MINPSDILAARILIVDDKPANVALLVQLLGGAGYANLTATHDPFAVCDLHRAHAYDLILLDLQMPGMDGFQVMQNLQLMQSDGYVPILVLTAQSGLKLRALASGAKDFIAKPFDLVEVKTRIHNMLEVRLLYKQLEHAVSTLESFALHDPLTRLPNRRLLMDRLQQVRLASTRSKHHCALMFLDIDHFKQLNDTLGHDAGDALLQQVSARLLSFAREGDTVARLGGDEFVVLLDGLSRQPEEAATQAEVVAHKMLDALGQTYQLGLHAYDTSLSIGVVIFLGELEAAGDLIKKADMAMYKAKTGGRHTVRFFDPVMQAQVLAHDLLLQDLRRGVLQQEFVLRYQVQVDAARAPIGAEALLHWRHPVKGVMHPDQFWHLAEESGTELALGAWALRAVCQQLLAWAKHPASAGWSISLSLSAGHFFQPDFVPALIGVLQASGVKPNLLMLGLTEAVTSQDIDSAMIKMSALKAFGVGVSLDEFGTGFSSLSQLKQLPLAQLKIAPSFVRTMLLDTREAAVTRTIVSLGQRLGLQVMANGVDNAEQYDLLVDMGCEAFQGEFIGLVAESGDF